MLLLLAVQVGVWAALKAKGVKEGDPVVIGATRSRRRHRRLRPRLLPDPAAARGRLRFLVEQAFGPPLSEPRG